MKTATSTEQQVSKVVKALEGAIIFGKLLPKQRIMEDEIVYGLKVKRHVARSALKRLEQQGILVRKPYCGVTVRLFSRAEIEDIYEAREMLHREAILKLKTLDDPQWIQKLEKINDKYAEEINNENISEIYNTNKLFHEEIFKGTKNEYIVKMIDYSNSLTHCIRSHALTSHALLDKSFSEHGEIISAIKAKDMDALSELTLRHMLPARKFYEDKFCQEIPFENDLSPIF